MLDHTSTLWSSTIRRPRPLRWDSGRRKTEWSGGSAPGCGKAPRRWANCSVDISTPKRPGRIFGTLEEESARCRDRAIEGGDRKITEAEWFLARKGDPGSERAAGAQANAAFYDADYLIAHPPVERVVPKGERFRARTMVAITNTYFDGLTAHDGTLILAHPGCIRLKMAC